MAWIYLLAISYLPAEASVELQFAKQISKVNVGQQKQGLNQFQGFVVRTEVALGAVVIKVDQILPCRCLLRLTGEFGHSNYHNHDHRDSAHEEKSDFDD